MIWRKENIFKANTALNDWQLVCSWLLTKENTKFKSLGYKGTISWQKTYIPLTLVSEGHDIMITKNVPIGRTRQFGYKM